jgi:hypothetical protein
MNKSRFVGLVAAASVAAGIVSTGSAVAASPGECAPSADICLVDDFGSVFSLWLEADTETPSPLDGSFVGLADVSPEIFPDDGLLCPVTGSYTQVGSAGAETYWNVAIDSNCSCDEGGNPAKRVVLMTLDNGQVVDGNLMTVHSLRCSGQIEMFRNSRIGAYPTDTDFAPDTSPDWLTGPTSTPF